MPEIPTSTALIGGEKDNKEWRKSHGDFVIRIDGKWYTEDMLEDRRLKALNKADLLYSRLVRGKKC